MRRIVVFAVSLVLSAPLAAKTIARGGAVSAPTALGLAPISLSFGQSNLPSLSAPILGESALVLPQAISLSPTKAAIPVRSAQAVNAASPKKKTATATAAVVEPRAADKRGVKAGLVRFAEAIGKKAAPMRGLILKLFDGSGGALGNAADEFAAEEAYARVERKEKREAVRHAEQKLPVYDYLPTRFDADSAASDFVEAVFNFSGTEKSGRAILEFLMTPHAVHASVEPDPERMDMPLFGRSDAEIRSFAQHEGIAGWRFNDVMLAAFRAGLIYRVHDRKRGKTFTGIPHRVREAFGLEAPSVESYRAPMDAAATEEGSRPVAESMKSLIALAGRMETLAGKDELFEFAAQAAGAASREGRLDWDSLPEGFRKEAEAYRSETGTLADALITLAESAYGTEWFDAAVAVAEIAASDGIVNAGELRDILTDLN